MLGVKTMAHLVLGIRVFNLGSRAEERESVRVLAKHDLVYLQAHRCL